MKLYGICPCLFLVIYRAVSFPIAKEKTVDLSHAFDEDSIGWITDRKFQLDVTQNGTTPEGYWAFSFPIPESKMVDLSHAFDEHSIGGWIASRNFELVVTQNGTTPEGYWLQQEEYSSGTHVGTHLDAPCHMVRGRWTIDQIPLNRLVGFAAVVDISCRAMQDRDAVLEVQDLQLWEEMAGRTLHDTIVLVRTGWSSRWPNREAYLGNDENDRNNLHFPGISPQAAQWLALNRQILGIGIDTLSLDSGSNIRFGVAAHQALLGANMYGIENLTNLHKLPTYGVTLVVSPMKIKNACGGPVRIMALLP